VLVGVPGSGLEVRLGVGVIEGKISSSPAAVGAGGAQADSITTAINSRDDQKGRWKLSFIIYALSRGDLR
jgi:hypothetical protein